eukprot:scaffold3722_cov263-Pinguiococcus_pyrenoidosus.AAC.10
MSEKNPRPTKESRGSPRPSRAIVRRNQAGCAAARSCSRKWNVESMHRARTKESAEQERKERKEMHRSVSAKRSAIQSTGFLLAMGWEMGAELRSM